MYKQIDAWTKRKGHRRLRWLGREVTHILLTFVVGVSIAMLYHELVTNQSVRSAAERICVLYGRDEAECKSNIDEALDMSDDEVQNNINIEGVSWVMWPGPHQYGTVKIEKEENETSLKWKRDAISR